jgi:NADH-quinone oxidoreductase subunit G
MKAFNIGPAADLTYPVEQLGDAPQLLNDIAAGKGAVAEALKNAKKPVVILGNGAVAREDGAAILAAAKQIGALCQRDGWNGFNLLQHAASRVGALDIGFVPGKDGKDMAGIVGAIANKQIKVVYLLGVDEIDMSHMGEAFVVYQGHHGDVGAHRADVILPGAAYTEKDGTYVNTEGRVQRGYRAVFAPGLAKEDTEVLALLATELGAPLPYSNLRALRERLVKEFPLFATLDVLQVAPFVAATKAVGAIDAAAFDPVVRNYYMSDPISRASKTMAQCTELHSKPHEVKAA